MSVKNYNPAKLSIVVGSRALSGFADGDFVTVSRDEDSFSLLTGADGESTRAKSSSKAGKIVVRLLATSASNDYLSDLSIADELSGNSTFTVLVKDVSGRSLYTAATAWVVKPADGVFGKGAGTREWTIQTDELIAYAAGN